MALLWRAAATAAARRRLGRPSAPTTIHGRFSSSSSSSSSSGTDIKTEDQVMEIMEGLFCLGLWIGAAAYTAMKVREPDFVSIREELRKKVDDGDIDRIKEELKRLQTSNAVLSRCLIDLQDERSRRIKQQQQVMATADIVVVKDQHPAASALPCRHGLEGEETGRGGVYGAGSWAQLQKESARPAENQEN